MNYPKHLDAIRETLDNLDLGIVAEIAEALDNARANGDRVYIFGNGGSAANASHWVNGFEGLLDCKCLSDNVPTITALANDRGYNYIFSDQLIGPHCQRSSYLIALTGSGNSRNVINGLIAGKQAFWKTIVLTGRDGGEAKELADICLIVPSDCMEIIEDIHSMIGHMLAMDLRERGR